MPYIDWEYYSSLYNNIQDEKEFNRVYGRAVVYMDRYTSMRARAFMAAYDENSATDFQHMRAEAIRMTMCELVSNIAIQEASDMGTGVTSVSNEGYSESYRITTASEKEAQLVCVIKNGLSSTGLAGAL